MGERDFLKWCREEIIHHVNSNSRSIITSQDVYVVWCCRTLQNNKALLSTTLPDGKYYECTYNGDKNELYLDVYVLEKNICITR